MVSGYATAETQDKETDKRDYQEWGGEEGGQKLLGGRRKGGTVRQGHAHLIEEWDGLYF